MNYKLTTAQPPESPAGGPGPSNLPAGEAFKIPPRGGGGLFFFFLFLFFAANVSSQELNAKVTVNSNKLSGVRQELFKSMQTSIMQLLNERKWTNANFGKNEMIDCSFVLTMNTAGENNTYTAELQITSRRPVYGSVYMTPIFTFKDVELEFEYAEGENLEFNETNISSNLVAVIAYYAYVVIGLDYDSFALNAGKPYFEMAMNIANAAQSLNGKGWKPFENDKNRYALALALTEESSARFHTMWYNYHRSGLDEMSTNLVRGKDRVMASTQDLQEIYSARPSSALLLFYGDTKLNELTDIYSEATQDERKEAYELLRKIFPTKSTQLAALRK
ncbi:type IX secretion system protein PorD [Viscerimonas tarda]